jgi:hypothetical protein
VKKFLLIVLLLVLPLQYSWAAAAVYCQHERGAATHPGHHAHQHQAQDGRGQDDVGDDGGATSKAFHADCESCHLFSHATLVPDMPAPLAPTAQSHRAAPARHYVSHIPDSPKRPDWLLVA